MSRATIDLLCADLPGAEASGPDAWTVGGEAFAVLDAASGVSVRAADAGEAAMLVAAGVAGPAPDPAGMTLPILSPETELRHRIVASYEIARRSLPRSVQVTLDRTSG